MSYYPSPSTPALGAPGLDLNPFTLSGETQPIDAHRIPHRLPATTSSLHSLQLPTMNNQPFLSTLALGAPGLGQNSFTVSGEVQRIDLHRIPQTHRLPATTTSSRHPLEPAMSTSSSSTPVLGASVIGLNSFNLSGEDLRQQSFPLSSSVVQPLWTRPEPPLHKGQFCHTWYHRKVMANQNH